MKKSRFLWILIDERQRLSNDRLLRFKHGRKEITVPRVISADPFYKDDVLIYGDFTVFKHASQSYMCIIGQIVNFCNDATLKKDKRFPYSYCILNINKSVMLTLSPCFSVQNTGRLTPYKNVEYSVKKYVCTVNSNVINFETNGIGRHNARKLKSILNL